MLGKIFGKNTKKRQQQEQEKVEYEWYERKSQLMEFVLGEEHDMVMHSVIPYELGGALDLYYYPSAITGTAIATKELARVNQQSATNDKYSKYEFVMFTKHLLDLDQAHDVATPFGYAHQNINAILNPIAKYAEEAKLNPDETCEFPTDFEEIGGKCLIFSSYGDKSLHNEAFGLMAVTEIFRSEMEFAMQNNGKELILTLKNKGIYPYSDMDREPVV